ncbi:MAG: hypothetical protein WD187_01220 [Candidatus Woykebacteria bacterium]
MAEDINLIPKEVTQKEETKGSINRTVNMAAIISLLVVAALLLALFGYQFFLSASSKRIENQTKEAEEQILAQSSKEISYRALVGKLEETSKFLSSQLNYSEAYGKLLKIFKDSGVVITDTEFKNDGNFSVSGDAKSSSNFGKLVDGLTDEQFKEDFDMVTLVSITKIEGEPYKFTVEFKVLKKGLFEATPSTQINK